MCNFVIVQWLAPGGATGQASHLVTRTVERRDRDIVFRPLSKTVQVSPRMACKLSIRPAP